jgi:hypothetical protein
MKKGKEKKGKKKDIVITIDNKFQIIGLILCLIEGGFFSFFTTYMLTDLKIIDSSVFNVTFGLLTPIYFVILGLFFIGNLLIIEGIKK